MLYMKDDIIVPKLVSTKRKANEAGYILRRNCVPKYVIRGMTEGRVGVTGRRGRRLKQLLGELKEKTGYWKLDEGTLDRILCRNRFTKIYGPSIRKTAK